MRLYIDLDKLCLVQSPTDSRAITRQEFKRGDGVEIELYYLRSGTPTRLATATTITFGCKPEGKFDADPLILHDTFAASDVGDPDDDPHYTGSPSFNTEALDTALAVDADEDNDVPYVDLIAEITWKTAGTEPTSIRTFIARVHNDVIRGDEGTPLALPTPEEWLDARSPRFDKELPLDGAGKQQLFENIGFTAYADLAAANAAEDVGTIYYDVALGRLNTVTA